MEVKSVQVNYEAGNSVKIIHGPLEGFVGKVIQVNPDKGQVQVSVSFFGRDTLADLELSEVELAED